MSTPPPAKAPTPTPRKRMFTVTLVAEFEGTVRIMATSLESAIASARGEAVLTRLKRRSKRGKVLKILAAKEGK